ncbi:ribonuclease 1-like [Gastrolobium bilobum]|uniref:ribonuclease 1-like n=1 Tax=Gastrolobium bilobum TaxID=150636 RepID=UPI002AB01558|nr:ribonuclease 1-like [Gastrolobium bilobum]
MKSKFLLALALLLLGILYCEANYYNTYDYLELALRWPNSYCSIHEGTCRDTVPQHFTISYLHPMKRGGPDLKYCPTPYPLPNSTIEANKNNLLRFWPDLTTDNFLDSQTLWKDQWKMYGSCSNMRPDDYIAYALNSIKRNDLKKILANAGIVPSGVQYPPDRILNVFRTALGVNVDIVCETDTNGNTYLAEVHQCVDYYGTTPIDCYHKAKGCDDNPIFPYPGFGEESPN